jgi:peptidoglycan/LPS O-acetylase OafA/YrhL
VDAVAGAGLSSNFQLWSEAGYFDNSADTKPLLHLWSLGIEEQFYIVWPLLLCLTRNVVFHLIAAVVELVDRGDLRAVIIIFFSISFRLNITIIQDDAVAAFYSPQARFWELLCGSLLAWSTFYKPNVFACARAGAAILGAPPDRVGKGFRPPALHRGPSSPGLRILSIQQ